MAAKYNGILRWVLGKMHHFNYEKYFKMREYLLSDHKRHLKDYVYYYKIKKMDCYNGASLGLQLGFGSASFKGRPILPHGLNGIIISNDVEIGSNVTIYHQVTISSWEGKHPIIGDNTLIGAGVKIVGGVKIGNNVKIGAGCVVACDVPDNATVVMEKPRIIIKE